MFQLPTVSEADTRDAFVATPPDDYELLDFGGGRKPERWGEFLVDSTDRQAAGLPVVRNWNAEWIHVADVGLQAHWEPTRAGLPREWTVLVDGRRFVCRLEPRGQAGLHGRDIPCAQWVHQRIEVERPDPDPGARRARTRHPYPAVCRNPCRPNGAGQFVMCIT
jgi:hypothetical protein